MIKVLIFDMDDTLVNSSPLHKEAFRLTFKKYGADLNKIPPNVERTFMGKKLNEVAEDIIKFFSLKVTADKIMKERESLILKKLKKVQPMPGLKSLLRFLKLSRYKIALVTDSTKPYVKIIMKKFKIDEIFKIKVTGEEVTKGKPNPQIFLIALKKLKLKPTECVVIEDAKNGILAAKMAGMKTIGVVNNKFITKQDLSLANVVIKDLAEIEKAVKTLAKK